MGATRSRQTPIGRYRHNMAFHYSYRSHPRAAMPALTDDQSDLVVSGFKLAMRRYHAATRAMPSGSADRDKAYDAVTWATIDAARTYDSDKGSFANFLAIRIKMELATAFSGRRPGRYQSPDELRKGDRSICRHADDVAMPECDDEGFDFLTKGLKPREREALGLIYREGLTEAEAGSVMVISQANVGRLKNTALEYLRWVHNASPQAVGSRKPHRTQAS